MSGCSPSLCTVHRICIHMIHMSEISRSARARDLFLLIGVPNFQLCMLRLNNNKKKTTQYFPQAMSLILPFAIVHRTATTTHGSRFRIAFLLLVWEAHPSRPYPSASTVPNPIDSSITRGPLPHSLLTTCPAEVHGARASNPGETSCRGGATHRCATATKKIKVFYKLRREYGM